MRTTRKQKAKVALIEFYPFHSELIYSQLLFLYKSNCTPILICNKQNAINYETIKNFATIKTYDMQKPGSLLRIWYFLLNSKINNVVFNTAQGPSVLKFSLLPFPKRIKFSGILHNTNKLNSSFGQRIITRRVKSYLVLASYMKAYFPQKNKISSIHVNCAYAPSFNNCELIKPEKEVWIGVPGSIEYKRRDYDFLLELASDPSFPENIKIILLGNASKHEGPSFIKKLTEQGLEQKFIVFNNFVPDSQFQCYMKSFDFLLPLIHPTTPSADAYLKYKASGTFIQSSTYSKPMLCHKMFNTNLFDYSALFYSTSAELINSLKSNRKPSKSQAPVFEQDRSNYYSFVTHP